MKHWRLRTQFMAAYAGLIVLGFAVLAVLAGRQISQGVVEDFEANLVDQASVVARGMKETIEKFAEGKVSQTAVSTLLADYAASTQSAITLIAPNGQVWAVSDGAVPIDNQLAYPEIASAAAGTISYDVRTNEKGETAVFAAAPIAEDGKLLSIVQLSAPLAEARALVRQRWLSLAGGVLLLTVLAMLASWQLSNSLTRPLTQLRATALKMAEGDLSQRLPETRKDEIGELATAFNHMAAQVEAMLAEQRAFASNASHELRTPLTTIRLRSEALRDGTVDEETARQYIIEIDEEVRRMGNLVQDLILLSRLDANRVEPGREQADIRHIVRSVVRALQPKADEKKLHLQVEMPQDLPVMTANLSHVQIVVRNLVENAIKYTPDGGQVTIRCQHEDGYLRLVVQDTGMGIAPENLPHLFKRFYRADKGRTRRVEGVGLGLALVKTIVTLYNGRISVDSPGLGQGTIVQVWWPL
ncbi:MAG: hypothetical protein Kow0080_21890 [Candidatus Promineifilaceae bacterium]